MANDERPAQAWMPEHPVKVSGTDAVLARDDPHDVVREEVQARMIVVSARSLVAVERHPLNALRAGA